ncbi:hypothetical protein VDF98_03835 [Xanthomonas campestris pv. raphani]|uniref:hypothetical protein n=1 Tax=Xanthomonas campestris TaxID=339 RepID=UPI0023676A73|nr:hypothetical protein [Xanthomonas campestris]MEA9822332.1 hypothetical protein [Xanthomonas campestris pv. raphani]MEA9850935.1 hypothetical protein [Xanthomonas campestris pv. raphani]MEA9855108.1 hypothetical protein [Xanthomonas campestris pv. raphani]MEA9963775.1 hypothetical protein [Xanthomonas campestris pv. raphani]WDJ20493.1 hypothetical protein JH270_11075 [Xanthomonas campestris pv. raphani]
MSGHKQGRSEMANTCIVCGQAAGSGEHVFPAALGGRRINKKIYCTKHDNGYSGLVADLANQMDVLNAQLGVVPDHSDDVKSVYARDPHTGEELRLSVKQNSFTASRVISQQHVENGLLVDMSFPNREAMQQWLAEQKAMGIDVKLLRRPEERPYFLDAVHHRRRFGGRCGLGAVAYVTQTFLAQAFPELARSNDVADFITYTQAIAAVAQIRGGCGEPADGPVDPKLGPALQTLEAAQAPWGGHAPVWWDFDPQPDATPNAFEFGHRVVVGVDAADGQIFGRFSLFSAIHFGMHFGDASAGVTTRTVTVDIDPMAAHPPNDIKKVEAASATARVTRPADPTEGLATAISGNTQEAVFTDLIQRIEAHSLAKTAAKMHVELAAYSIASYFEGDKLIGRVVDGQAQRVFNMAKWVLKNFKQSLPAELLPVLGPIIDSMTAHDPTSINGLSQMASATLELAKAALVAKMREDIVAGRLDERRIVELMGEGPGAAVVGEIVLAPIMQAIEREKGA